MKDYLPIYSYDHTRYRESLAALKKMREDASRFFLQLAHDLNYTLVLSDSGQTFCEIPDIRWGSVGSIMGVDLNEGKVAIRGGAKGPLHAVLERMEVPHVFDEQHSLLSMDIGHAVEHLPDAVELITDPETPWRKRLDSDWLDRKKRGHSR